MLYTIIIIDISVYKARVQYTPTSERCFRIDSLLFPGVSPFVGVPSTRGIEQLNPVFSPSAEVVHVCCMEILYVYLTPCMDGLVDHNLYRFQPLSQVLVCSKSIQ